MFDVLVEYVRENYSRARKIVEIGVGSRIDVAERIKKQLPLTDVLVTDKDEAWVQRHKTGQVRPVADDVMFPQTRIYESAGLIYSIHPPVEIVASIAELVSRIGADLLIVPRSDEQEAFHTADWQKIVRKGRTVGWLRVFNKENQARRV
jgi:uncharacterized UPF0146 family protein